MRDPLKRERRQLTKDELGRITSRRPVVRKIPPASPGTAPGPVLMVQGVPDRDEAERTRRPDGRNRRRHDHAQRVGQCPPAPEQRHQAHPYEVVGGERGLC
jgi:hypothetical protein